MKQALEQYPNLHEFLLYSSGAGGETLATLVTTHSNSYYKYDIIKLPKTNQTKVWPNFWRGWLNGQKNDDNIIYNSTDEFFDGFGDTSIPDNLRDAFKQNKTLLSIGHSTSSILMNSYPNAKFVVIIPDSTHSLFESEVCRYMKLEFRRITYDQIYNEIQSSGKTPDECSKFWDTYGEFFGKLTNLSETNDVYAFLFTTMFWANKTIDPVVLASDGDELRRYVTSATLKHMSADMLPTLSQMQYYHNLPQSHMYYRWTKQHPNVTHLPFSSMFTSDKLKSIFSREIDVDAVAAGMRAWRDENFRKMDEFENQIGMPLRKMHGFVPQW